MRLVRLYVEVLVASVLEVFDGGDVIVDGVCVSALFKMPKDGRLFVEDVLCVEWCAGTQRYTNRREVSIDEEVLTRGRATSKGEGTGGKAPGRTDTDLAQAGRYTLVKARLHLTEARYQFYSNVTTMHAGVCTAARLDQVHSLVMRCLLWE